MHRGGGGRGGVAGVGGGGNHTVGCCKVWPACDTLKETPGCSYSFSARHLRT